MAHGRRLARQIAVATKRAEASITVGDGEMAQNRRVLPTSRYSSPTPSPAIGRRSTARDLGEPSAQPDGRTFACASSGRTRKEAEELHHYLQSKVHPDVGLELLSNQLGGFDLSEYDLDGPLPDIPERQFALRGLGNTRNIIRWAREERLTIRQIYQRFAAARRSPVSPVPPRSPSDGFPRLQLSRQSPGAGILG